MQLSGTPRGANACRAGSSAPTGRLEPSSDPAAGCGVDVGTTVLDEELVIGGDCSFDTEFPLCFLMDGVQAYRFRS